MISQINILKIFRCTIQIHILCFYPTHNFWNRLLNYTKYTISHRTKLQAKFRRTRTLKKKSIIVVDRTTLTASHYQSNFCLAEKPFTTASPVRYTKLSKRYRPGGTKAYITSEQNSFLRLRVGMYPMHDLCVRGGRGWRLGSALRRFLCLGIETYPMRGLRVWGRR